MKHALLVLSLLIAACGSEETAKTTTPAPVQQQPETPKVEDSKAEAVSPLVGNWIDAESHTLVFKKGGTATTNDQPLSWSLKEGDYVLFSAETIDVDLCHYEISTKGNLKDPLSIVLDMSCAASGELHYSKNNK